MATTVHQGLTVVVGLGKTGLACARFLRAQGAPVAVTDSRAVPPELARARQELPELTVALGGFDRALLAQAQQVVVSPGVSLAEPELAELAARGVPLLSEIELFAQAARAPVVAVTGSNGKSTVITLLGLMAERAGVRAGVGGNLGTPALDLLDPATELYLLELSSFQLETTQSLVLAAAAVLNVSADHMDRHHSLAAYAGVKAQVYARADVCVVNADDAVVMAMPRSGRSIEFSVRPGAAVRWGVTGKADGLWISRAGEALLPVAELRIAGRHNLANALAALALGEAVGLPVAEMLAVLRGFPGLAHRTEWLGEAGGVAWYNDSKGTNVGAAVAAIEGLGRPVVLIAGGEGKGQDFSVLKDALGARARVLILIGRDAALIEQAVDGALPILHAADMDAAVQQAVRQARPGDAVLLSPACASYDMFSGYEQRGDVFREAVRRWAL
jgi:UDP-N-acetylmuramoylalanine--D-glutamate ligase